MAEHFDFTIEEREQVLNLYTELKEKVVSEILYMNNEIILIANEVNNIEYSKYKVEIEEIQNTKESSEQNSKNENKESSQSDSQQQKSQESESSKNSEKESSGSEKSGSSQNSQDQQDNKEKETIIIYFPESHFSLFILGNTCSILITGKRFLNTIIL